MRETLLLILCYSYYESNKALKVKSIEIRKGTGKDLYRRTFFDFQNEIAKKIQ